MRKKQSLKKLVSSVIATAVIVTNPLTAYSASGTEASDSIMSSSLVSSVSNKTVSKSGYSAFVTLKVLCSGTATLSLQVSNSNASGGWETIDSVSNSFSDTVGISLSKQINVASGTYRLHTHVSSGNQTFDDYSMIFCV